MLKYRGLISKLRNGYAFFDHEKKRRILLYKGKITQKTDLFFSCKV